MPYFSLIVPIYNLASYITDCLSSIDVQSFRDYEVIVIDDGSTDDSYQICLEWSRTHPKCMVLRKDNGGVSSARNLGLEHASGRYVWFVDGDDFIHPDSLQVLNEIFTRNPELDYIQHKYNYTHVRYNNFDFNDIASSEIEIHDMTFKSGFAKVLNYAPIAVWDMCCRRELLRGIRFEEICTSEDRLFSLNMVYRSHSMAFYSGIIYNVYLRPDSFSRQTYTRHIFSDYLTFVNLSLSLVGQRDGWGDGVLCFFNERTNFPHLMRKIRCFPNKSDRLWAWESILLIIKSHCALFDHRIASYIRWIDKTHSFILAWFFLVLRYDLRDWMLKSPRLTRIWKWIRG